MGKHRISDPQFSVERRDIDRYIGRGMSGSSATREQLSISVGSRRMLNDRRIGGAGRRSGDLARALKTGEPVIYQVGKGAMAKKVLGKAGKLGKLALGGIAIYDMVNRNKQ